jgi:hypothetical protein
LLTRAEHLFTIFDNEDLHVGDGPVARFCLDRHTGISSELKLTVLAFVWGAVWNIFHEAVLDKTLPWGIDEQPTIYAFQRWDLSRLITAHHKLTSFQVV